MGFDAPGHQTGESVDGTNTKLNFRETYVEGGRFEGSKLGFWAGKKFYREGDLFMNDWYYFGDASGNGFGINGIDLGFGKLELGYIKNVQTTKTTNHGNLV